MGKTNYFWCFDLRHPNSLPGMRQDFFSNDEKEKPGFSTINPFADVLLTCLARARLVLPSLVLQPCFHLVSKAF
jgi:hypothetical protein